MFQYGESAILQELENPLIIHARPYMVFGNVTCRDDWTTEHGVSSREEFSYATPETWEYILRVKKDLCQGNIERTEHLSPRGISRGGWVANRIEKTSGSNARGGSLDHRSVRV